MESKLRKSQVITAYWLICETCGRTVDKLNSQHECKDCDPIKIKDE